MIDTATLNRTDAPRLFLVSTDDAVHLVVATDPAEAIQAAAFYFLRRGEAELSAVNHRRKVEAVAVGTNANLDELPKGWVGRVVGNEPAVPGSDVRGGPSYT
jgi:hypothetical protein